MYHNSTSRHSICVHLRHANLGDNGASDIDQKREINLMNVPFLPAEIRIKLQLNLLRLAARSAKTKFKRNSPPDFSPAITELPLIIVFEIFPGALITACLLSRLKSDCQ